MVSTTGVLLLLVVVFVCDYAEELLNDCGMYQIVVNGETLECGMCGPGYYRKSHCTKTEGTVCVRCPSSKYNNGCSRAPECADCSLYCDKTFHHKVETECTPHSDLQCNCEDGYWRPPDFDPDEPCILLTACGPGQGAVKGSKTADTVCTGCENGMFSNLTVNVNQPCKPWTVTKCEKESLHYKPGTTTTDSMCVNVTAGLRSEVIVAICVVPSVVILCGLICAVVYKYWHRPAEAADTPATSISASTVTTDDSATTGDLPTPKNTESPFANNGPSAFGKLHDDSSFASILPELASAVPSVGLLYSEDGQIGSCFRVGDCYIMTCFHVISKLMDKKPWENPTETDSGKLAAKKLGVMFNYSKPLHFTGDRYALDSASPLTWCNPGLDIAVLKLTVPSSGRHPVPPLTVFRDLQFQNVFIMGHPNAEAKKFETCIPVTSDMLQTTLEWASNNNKTHLYTAAEHECSAEDKQYLTYNSKLEHGASGSPCFTAIHEDGAAAVAVVAVHGRGFPKLTHRADIPTEHTFEQGVKISAAYQKMRSEDSSLCANIFEDIPVAWGDQTSSNVIGMNID